MPSLTLDTPTGPFTLTEGDGHIVRAGWHAGGDDHTSLLIRARDQIAEYFAGTRRDFDLPLGPGGSETQKRICAAIAAIPFGETPTYGDLARDLSLPAQTIGQGCGGNPIPLLIPCHRVLSATGLGGFSGTYGIETKVWLLKHEGAASLLI